MLKKILKSPLYYLILAFGRILPDNIPSDLFFLKLLYKNRMRKKLDLTNPETYNEKLQWLKLFDRNPRYTQMADKLAVKEYVSEVLGREYIIPTLGSWEKFDNIDFNTLPNRFVLKCNHDSGGVVICKDKSKLDINHARKIINHSLRRKYYKNTGEWPYKDIKPLIFAEKYMVDESGYELRDYKFFVFSGQVKAMYIATDRMAETETCFDFYDRDFNHLPFVNSHPNSKNKIDRPDNYEEMIAVAEKLGKGLKHIRVDLYNIHGKIYFGEITFFHMSGLQPFIPEEWDYRFGSWLQLDLGEKNEIIV